MPKVFDQCVLALKKKGTPSNQAYAICTASFKKSHHGMTPAQAKAKGMEDVVSDEMLVGMPDAAQLEALSETLLQHNAPLTVLEEAHIDESGKHHPFRYEGTALFDGAISKNKRWYPKEACDAALAATNAAIEGGLICTVYGTHDQATGGGGFFSSGAQVHYPIGKVTKLFRKEERIKYEAALAETRDGADAAVLIRGGFVGPTSIRSYHYEQEMVEVGDEVLAKMKTFVIAGIDMCQEAGIEGAGIDRVLESAKSTPFDPSTEEVEETVMDWTKVTLEELQTNVLPLLDKYAGAKVTAAVATEQAKVVAAEAKAGDWQNKTVASDTALLALRSQLDAAAAKLAEQMLHVAVLEAAQNPLTALVARKMTAVAKKAEDITPALLKTLVEESRNEILVAAGVPLGGITPGSGLPVPLPTAAKVAHPDQVTILRLAS